MNIFPATLLPLTFIALVSCSDATTAQAEPQKPKPVKVDKLPDIVTTDLGSNIYMFKGQGGNIGVSNGPDGLVVIDDQYARMAPKIRAALKTINDAPVTVSYQYPLSRRSCRRECLDARTRRRYYCT